MPAVSFRHAGNVVGDEDGVLACLALRRVIVERGKRPFAEQQDRDEVHDRHEAHEDVG